MKRTKQVRVRPSVRFRSVAFFPKVESLEDRLPPGDTFLGGVLAGCWLGQHLDALDFDLVAPAPDHSGTPLAWEALAVAPALAAQGSENTNPPWAVVANHTGLPDHSTARFVAESALPPEQPAAVEPARGSHSLPGSELAGRDTDWFDQLLANDFDSLTAQPSPQPVSHVQAGKVAPSRAEPVHDMPVVAPGALSRAANEPVAPPVHGTIQPWQFQEATLSALTRVPGPGRSNSGHTPPPGGSADSGGCSGGASPPVANDDSYSVIHDRVLGVDAPGVLANDTDPNGCALSAVEVSGPNNGGLTLNSDGSFTYTPNYHFVGTDSFTYYATNGVANSNTATVTIMVTNQPPVAVNDSYTVSHNQTLMVDAAGVLGNDYDPDGDLITASLVSGPTHGILMQFGADGSFTYAPNLSFTGTDSLTYVANDGIANSNVATVTITVTNTPPVANNDTYGVHPNMTLSVSAPGVLGNDTDADGDALTAALMSNPSNGGLAFNSDGSFTYTPNTGFQGNDSFTYVANDGIANSSVATVTLNVHGINHPPMANDDSYSVLHDHTLTVDASGVLGNDTDADGDPLTAILVSNASSGSVALNSDGSFSYTPNHNFAGTDSFTYKANDGMADSNVATVTITVTDNPPSAGDNQYTILHDHTLTVAASGVLGNASDPDGDPLTAGLVSGPSNGMVTLNNDGSFTYVPNLHFAGTDTFTYVANDGILNSNVATATIYVTDAAPVGVNDSYHTPHGQTLTVAGPGVLGNDYDPDMDPLTAVQMSNPANGMLTFNSNGSFSYTPNPNFIGNDTFTYQPFDGILYGNTTTVTISVTGDRPIANDDEYATGINQSLTVSASGVLGNDASPDGNSLAAVLVSGASNGNVSLGSDGSFTYTPNTDFSGDDSFTYNASDAGLLSVLPAVVTIHVVKIDLQMTGVGAGQKLNPGGFVMINANNDNGSRVTNEIPARRDFDVNPLPRGVNDPDLVQVNVAITPNTPLPGFFVLSVANNGMGRIRLWNNRNKGAQVGGVYTSATLPQQFFVEGTVPSAAQRENTITLQYFYISTLGIPTAAARDDVAVTVTPVVNFLNITTQGAAGVVFTASLLNPPVNNGLLGMTTVGQNNNLGAVFDAQVVQRGATGNLVFVQNIGVPGGGGFPGFVNGFAGGPANGLTFTAASGIAARNWMFVDPRNRRRVREVLDMAFQQKPPPPDYRGLFRPVPTGNPDLLQITAQDGPNTTTAYPAPAFAQFLTNIAVQYNFRVYLVWRFGNAPNTIIYTLATNDWNVVFRADTFAARQGVTRIVAGSGVFSPNPMNRNNHDNPIVVRPTGNESVTIR